MRAMAVIDAAAPLQRIAVPEPTAATRAALRFAPAGCDEAGNVILTVVNISENQWNNATYGASLDGDTGTWEEIFNSKSRQYGGWNDSGNYLAFPSVADDGRIFIRLPKWSVLIFRKR
jgi:hypothetical protein